MLCRFGSTLFCSRYVSCERSSWPIKCVSYLPRVPSNLLQRCVDIFKVINCIYHAVFINKILIGSTHKIMEIIYTDWFFYDPDRWCDSYDPLDLYGSRSPVRKTVILHNLRSDFESNEDNQPRDTSIHHAYNSPSMSPSRPIPIPHSPATSHSNSSRSVKTTSEIQSLSSSFELHIYTSILTTVNNELLNQCRNLSFKTEKILDYFRVGSGISLYVHDMLLLLQTDINRLKSALTQCYSSLDVLLTDIEAMTLMNLSPLCKDPSLYR